MTTQVNLATAQAALYWARHMWLCSTHIHMVQKKGTDKAECAPLY